MIKKHFKIIMLCLAILQIATICFAQNRNIYHNLKGTFSFTIPDNWEEIPKNIIDTYYRELQEFSTQPLERFEAAFQLRSDNYFTYPYVVIQVDQSGKWSEDKIQEFISKEGKKTLDEGISEVPNILPDLINNAKIREVIYDRESNIVFFKAKMNIVNVGRILLITSICLSNKGYVQINFYSREDDFHENLPYFNQIIESFKFDKGYEYQYTAQESVKRNPLLSIMRAAIIGGLIGFIIAGLVYSLRYLIWRGEVPKIISNARWVIAVIIGVLITIIEFYMIKIDIEKIIVINAFITWLIAQALKREKDEVRSKG